MNASFVVSVLSVNCRQFVVSSAFVLSRFEFRPSLRLKGRRTQGKGLKKNAVNKEPIDSGARNLGKKGKEKRS
jgi:hypothetical protein